MLLRHKRALQHRQDGLFDQAFRRLDQSDDARLALLHPSIRMQGIGTKGLHQQAITRRLHDAEPVHRALLHDIARTESLRGADQLLDRQAGGHRSSTASALAERRTAVIVHGANLVALQPGTTRQKLLRA